MIKLEKGKSSHRICEINKRHKAAECLLEEINYRLPTPVIPDMKWSVYSSNLIDFYTVLKQKGSCECKLHCRTCNACIHMYTCTCIDSMIHTTVCKHIHIVDLIYNKSSTHPSSDNQDDEFLKSINYFTQTLAKETPNSKVQNIQLTEMRESMAIMIKELQTVSANCNNIEALQGSVTHIRAAIAIIKAIQIHDKTATKSVLLQKKRYATNSNMEKQLRFYSTKKRRVTTSRWAKPNEEDISNSKATLMNSSGITVCGICFMEEDNMYTEVIDWLQCEKCSIWVHKQCVKAPMLLSSDTFLYEYCT